ARRGPPPAMLLPYRQAPGGQYTGLANWQPDPLNHLANDLVHRLNCVSRHDKGLVRVELAQFQRSSRTPDKLFQQPFVVFWAFPPEKQQDIVANCDRSGGGNRDTPAGPGKRPHLIANDGGGGNPGNSGP